jgi:hypothetical protein
MNKFLIIGLCMLLASCSFGSGPQDPNLRTGTKSLSVTFLEQSPPPFVFQNSPFSMTFKLANEGAAPIDNGVISINAEQDLVIVQGERVRTFTLDGKRAANVQGDNTLETIQLRSKALPPQTEIVTTQLGATFCYPYATHAELTTCIDTDVFNRATTKPCKTQSQSFSGQGGPVSVSKIEPVLTPSEDATKISAQYLITVRNLGTGQVFDATKSAEACTPGATPNWNNIGIIAFLGDTQLACTDVVTLENKETTLRCDVPEGIPKSAGTYTTTLTVDLTYGYTFQARPNQKVDLNNVRSSNPP